MFSKIYQQHARENLSSYVTFYLSDFASTQRKKYNAKHVILILIENRETIT